MNGITNVPFILNHPVFYKKKVRKKQEKVRKSLFRSSDHRIGNWGEINYALRYADQMGREYRIFWDVE